MSTSSQLRGCVYMVLYVVVMQVISQLNGMRVQNRSYHKQRRRKDFLVGGAQSETTHRVVSNLYNNL